MSRSVLTLFRLHIYCMLLSGGFFRSCFISITGTGKIAMPLGLVSAKEDKEDDKEKDDKKKDDKKKDDKNNDTELPSMQPSLSPSKKPTHYPTKRPITQSPTRNPRTNPPTVLPINKDNTIQNLEPSSLSHLTNFPSGPIIPLTISEVRLPEITIDIISVVDDVFSFAALLLEDGGIERDAINCNGINDCSNNNRKGLNDFFRRFVEDLLIASRVIDSSVLESIDLEIALLPSKDDDNENDDTSLLIKTLNDYEPAAKFTPMRIVLDGKMSYYTEKNTNNDDENEDKEKDELSLEDFISHTLTVYFTFWKTDEMVSKLSDFGLTNPQITSVSVDGKLILVAGDTTSGTVTNDESNNNVNGGDETGNLLIVSNDGNKPVSIKISENVVERSISSRAALRTKLMLIAPALISIWTVLV